MPQVLNSVFLGRFERADVWPILADFARYPDFMPDVLEVQVPPAAGGEMHSTWRVLLNGSELTWTEADRLVEHERIEFHQTDGDLETWYGEWVLVERDDGLHVDLSVTFDIGIPSLADVLHPIGERAIRANSQQMLAGIRDRLHARHAAALDAQR
ncbi:type II toxin-antitoxin system RatA family toxin [Burkholderia plantarii]|uniref:Putative polyketide cyclase/dehydrase n=1 Tax=Burkholderia plantarii TaxID=41899 RepID=A0A0B6RUM1_BURPL|nr:aromatase/cyclase [Burkholderia plantarii]AJK49047.1 putative polyketide cyclase/dehydrase [Burkholderia plantarii]ALK33302.1 cyclase/dehydrase [Burkholderia plantarii]WLE62356.1 aromatase/cyclase [Burkholderia plantarii]GLZ22289.1 cyclase [Burkholderia plantarii]